jgi:nitric oxide reductase NorD protein
MGINLFEPEETVGMLWHRLITRGTEETRFPAAAVELAGLQRRLVIFFHGLGGDPGIELKPIGSEVSKQRRSWRERLGHVERLSERARLDGDSLFLPKRLDLLPERQLNEDLYFWLTAFAASAGDDRPQAAEDPLAADLAYLRFAEAITRRTRQLFPGTRPLYRRLAAAVLALRPERQLPEIERQIEDAIRTHLSTAGDFIPHPPEAAPLRLPDQPRETPFGYRTFMPVVLWGDCTAAPARHRGEARDPDDLAGASPPDDEDEAASDRTIRASRKPSDLAERRDSLLLYPFSGLISWLEKLNLNRHVDDEDAEAARKALDEADEIELGAVSKKPATKLRFDLDLAPEEIERERLAGKHTYPEWDYRAGAYLADHVRVLEGPAEEAPSEPGFLHDEGTRQRINAVRRRFEALRPKRETLRRQVDGSEFDMDALVRSRCDLAADGHGSDGIYLTTRPHARDLAVLVLIDISRSTESWIEGRQVLAIEKEALAALSLGLKASGDSHAIHAFSSARRDRVFLQPLKDFDEPAGGRVLRRIEALRPGHYTRMGAALRHAAGILAERPNRHRLLLLITDGKPNDLDHYEGRYGIEDTRMAVIEARRQGLAVFGVTIDKKAQGYFPHMFGRGGYAIVPHPDRLTRALPLLFQHLVV